jgi:outer membrane lipoprotein-sorting protein
MDMKKLALLVLLGVFLAGCGQQAARSEFWQHQTMYSSWDHMKFSWSGFTEPTEEDVRLAQEQGWWGIEVPHVPE